VRGKNVTICYQDKLLSLLAVSKDFDTNTFGFFRTCYPFTVEHQYLLILY